MGLPSNCLRHQSSMNYSKTMFSSLFLPYFDFKNSHYCELNKFKKLFMSNENYSIEPPEELCKFSILGI